MEQMIISIGREFGSAGHEIAERLAAQYQLPLYDHNLLDEIAGQKGLDSRDLRAHDEVRRSKLLNRKVRGMDSSPSYNLALLQFDFLREKAESGESFVVVGRCSETVLKPYKGLISIFVQGDMDKKVARIMELYHKTQKDAEDFIKEKDKRRRQYHNSHCDLKWGDSRNYHLCINSSKLGVDETLNILIQYIDARKKVL
ncbi:MAG TPA: cytidylate kinase-like family protein [Candidatus Choladousia intestinigallinarum]|nr:cytidylate kinase-like family protein [Candidatus Choladousia intestinigallinarum]